MAWTTDEGKHQHRKLASSSTRSAERRAAISAANDPPTNIKKTSRPKNYGLKFSYKSMFKRGKLMSYVQWYETERDRAQAEKVAKEQRIGGHGDRPGRLRYESIERVSK